MLDHAFSTDLAVYSFAKQFTLIFTIKGREQVCANPPANDHTAMFVLSLCSSVSACQRNKQATRYTDVHAGATTCTDYRYLMTGIVTYHRFIEANM